jgi:transketolase
VLRDVFAEFRTVTDKPKVFIADTIKGKGVSFMRRRVWRSDLRLPRGRAVAHYVEATNS